MISAVDMLTIDKEILLYHNTERSKVGVPLLELDVNLTLSAQKWADELARLGRLEHSHIAGVGENVACRSPAKALPILLFSQWLNEKINFSDKTWPTPKITGKVVNHYSQIVWNTTTKLGVGYASDDRNTYLVCQYTPVGNIIGKHPY